MRSRIRGRRSKALRARRPPMSARRLPCASAGRAQFPCRALSDGMFVVNSGRNASNRLRTSAASRARVKTRSPERKALTSARNELHRSGTRIVIREFRVRGTGGEYRFDGRDHGAALLASVPKSASVTARHGIRRIVPQRDGCVPVLIRDARIAFEHFDIPSVRRTGGSVRTIVHHAPPPLPFHAAGDAAARPA